jgi:hypothetical protein
MFITLPLLGIFSKICYHLRYLFQIYIFGGSVANSSSEKVEVLDTTLSTIQPLLATDGQAMSLSSLANIIMPCAVGLDDLNAIFVAGGSTNGTRLSGLSLNLKKVKYE